MVFLPDTLVVIVVSDNRLASEEDRKTEFHDVVLSFVQIMTLLYVTDGVPQSLVCRK